MIRLASPLAQAVAAARDVLETRALGTAVTGVADAVLGSRLASLLQPELDVATALAFAALQWAQPTLGAVSAGMAAAVIVPGPPPTHTPCLNATAVGIAAAHRRVSTVMAALALARYCSTRLAGSELAVAAQAATAMAATAVPPGSDGASSRWLTIRTRVVVLLAALLSRCAAVLARARQALAGSTAVHVLTEIYGPLWRAMMSAPVAAVLSDAYASLMLMRWLPTSPWLALAGVRMISSGDIDATALEGSWHPLLTLLGRVLAVQAVARAVKVSVSWLDDAGLWDAVLPHRALRVARDVLGTFSAGAGAGGAARGQGQPNGHGWDALAEADASSMASSDAESDTETGGHMGGGGGEAVAASWAPQCPICRQTCRYATATPCGHVYCWRCIVRATMARCQCPMCRRHVQPQQLLPLLNCR